MDLILKNKEKFDLYFKFLVSENEKYNLTSITNENEVYIKHFMDSLALSNIISLENDISICDVGSGAGFPSIPLKICYPNIKLTIIEPTLKRCNFLNELIKLLSLDNVEIINGRAEDYARNYNEKFDIVTARAVSNTRVLLELLVRFCKINKDIVLYKGSKAIEELNESKNCLKLLDLNVNNIYKYELENDLGERYLIDLKKMKETNVKYPRKYQDIKRKPL